MIPIEQLYRSHKAVAGQDPTPFLNLARTLSQCAEICVACADACLAEQDVASLRRCIGLNRDCADVCEVTARILLRRTEFDRALVGELLRVCRVACEACAAECDDHASLEHCRVCAEHCRHCAEACRQAGSSFAQ